MTQEEKNRGKRDLANMLKLFCQEEDEQDEEENEIQEENDSNEHAQAEDNPTGTKVGMEDVGEMFGTMLVEDSSFSSMCEDPKFAPILKQTIEGVKGMISGAHQVVKDLPEKGLTVESGLAAVAEAMLKSSTRSSSHEFIEYVIHEDKQMAMDIMSKMYDGMSGVKVVWLTLFFIEKGWLTEPSPTAIKDTFNVMKFTKQLYSANKKYSIPDADHKAFTACLENHLASYKSQGK